MKPLRDQKSARTWYIDGGVAGFDLSTLPRCEGVAKTTGERCKRAAKRGKKLCGIHNGNYTPSAPKGNCNSLKHGLYTATAVSERKAANNFISESNTLLDEILCDFKI